MLTVNFYKRMKRGGGEIMIGVKLLWYAKEKTSKLLDIKKDTPSIKSPKDIWANQEHKSHKIRTMPEFPKPKELKQIHI